MANIKTTDNKNFDIYMNADMFIVPNKAGKILPEYIGSSLLDKEFGLIEANNYDFDIHNDKFAQVWLLSTDEKAKCDNLNDHSVHFTYDGKLIFVSYLCSRLPLKVLANLKEGDTIGITYPVRGTHDISVYDLSQAADEDDFKNWKNITEDVNINVDLHLHVTCNQQDYRYRRFGKFEDAVAYID